MNFIKNLKLNKKKSAFVLVVFVLTFVLSAFWYKSIAADSVVGLVLGDNFLIDHVQKFILLGVGYFLQFLLKIIGYILSLVIGAIISVASYNDFIGEPNIIKAWAIIRDFCNMFFILILLVIAFATILRIESYNMKKWLPKLLLMAVLINFSRTIAGLIIDFSQVFMLTFVSAIGDTGGSIVNALGVESYFSLVLDKTKLTDNNYVDFMSTLSGLLMGFLLILIASIVLIVFLSILVIRTVMLWIYVVLSPLAFLLGSFPGGQKYWTRWWDEFIKQVITGPVLMFFFWLALITATNFDIEAITSSSAKCFGAADSLCPDKFIHFIMSIGMLLGGLTITAQVGGAVGGIASKGLARAKKLPGQLTKRAGAVAKVPTRAATNRIGARINRFGERGITRNEDGQITAGSMGRKLTSLAGSWMHESAQGSYNSDAKKLYKKLGKLGMGDNSINYIRSITGGNVTGRTQGGNIRRTNEVVYHDPTTGQENTERNWLTGRIRNILLGGLHRSTDSGVVTSVREASRRAAVFGEVAREVSSEGPTTPTPSASDTGVSPSIVSRKNYEATKKWKENGSKESEFDKNLHYESNKFDMAQMIYEPTAEQKEKQKKEAGLSIKKFADGRSNMLGFDFEKLANNHLMAGAKNWNSVQGAFTSDPKVMKSLAHDLIRLLDDEVKNNGLTMGSEKRRSIEKAREKLQNPENLKDMILINTGSPAAKVSYKAVADTITHEKVHAAGDLTETGANSAGQNRTSKDKSASAGRQSTAEEVISRERGEKGGSTAEVNRIKEIVDISGLVQSGSKNTLAIIRALKAGLRGVSEGLGGLGRKVFSLAKLADSKGSNDLVVKVTAEEINKSVNSK